MIEPRRARELDGNHALLVGNVISALLHMQELLADLSLTRAEPVVVEDEYTTQIRIQRPSRTYVVIVETVEALEQKSP